MRYNKDYIGVARGSAILELDVDHKLFRVTSEIIHIKYLYLL